VIACRLPRVRAAASFAVIGLVLGGCGSGSGPAATQSAPAPAVVPAALRFTASTVAGGTVRGADLLAKPTVAWFWTPWCTICRAEAPDIAAAQAQFGDRVNFVGIAGRGPVADMARFVADTKVGAFPHAVDADGRLWSGFKVVSQPSLAFIHPDGRIETVTGSMSPADLRERIAKLTNA